MTTIPLRVISKDCISDFHGEGLFIIRRGQSLDVRKAIPQAKWWHFNNNVLVAHFKQYESFCFNVDSEKVGN